MYMSSTMNSNLDDDLQSLFKSLNIGSNPTSPRDVRTGTHSYVDPYAQKPRRSGKLKLKKQPASNSATSKPQSESTRKSTPPRHRNSSYHHHRSDGYQSTTRQTTSNLFSSSTTTRTPPPNPPRQPQDHSSNTKKTHTTPSQSKSKSRRNESTSSAGTKNEYVTSAKSSSSSGRRQTQTYYSTPSHRDSHPSPRSYSSKPHADDSGGEDDDKTKQDTRGRGQSQRGRTRDRSRNETGSHSQSSEEKVNPKPESSGGDTKHTGTPRKHDGDDEFSRPSVQNMYKPSHNKTKPTHPKTKPARTSYQTRSSSPRQNTPQPSRTPHTSKTGDKAQSTPSTPQTNYKQPPSNESWRHKFGYNVDFEISDPDLSEVSDDEFGRTFPNESHDWSGYRAGFRSSFRHGSHAQDDNKQQQQQQQQQQHQQQQQRQRSYHQQTHTPQSQTQSTSHSQSEFQTFVARWTKFEERLNPHPDTKVKIKDFPWPSKDALTRMLTAAKRISGTETKKQHRQLMMMLHPDKFMQKLRSYIGASEMELAESKITELSQHINSLKPS